MNSLQKRLTKDKNDKTLFRQSLDYALDYLDALHDRPPFPTPSSLRALTLLDENLPDSPSSATDILRQLHSIGSPATVAQGGGRYFGFVNGGLIPTALAARWLADAWDQNAALHVMSPIAAKLEAICESWLIDLLDLPANTAAGLLSGTSTATLCGLLAGRNTLLARQNWPLRERGLFGAPAIRVIVSEAAHATVIKALTILGIGAAQIETIPADDQGRLDPQSLPALDETCLLILQAGNVNSGAFDDFESICPAANQANAWTHIDGAFGLWARACAQKAYLTAAVDKADSWALDAHKTLNSPYDCGIILCKHPAALTSALQAQADYLQPSSHRDGMLTSPEMSRRARGIELWALLKSLGRSGVDALIAQLCARAKLFAEELTARHFRVLNDVVFNQALIACDTPELTARTLREIQTGGICWCGESQWQSQTAIRVSVCSWATSEEDLRISAEAFAAARERAREKSDHAI